MSENLHIPQPKFKPKLLANQRSLSGHSLVIQGLQNDKDTLHEFMKIPGTHSKKSVFFLSDSLGSPYLTIPPLPRPHTHRYCWARRHSQPPGSAEASACPAPFPDSRPRGLSSPWFGSLEKTTPVLTSLAPRMPSVLDTGGQRIRHRACQIHE